MCFSDDDIGMNNGDYSQQSHSQLTTNNLRELNSMNNINDTYQTNEYGDYADVTDDFPQQNTFQVL